MPTRSQTLASLAGLGDYSAVALVAPEDTQGLRYGELADAVESLARCLRRLGVERGDRVALALPNGPEIVQLLLAIMSLGAAAAPLNPAYTRDEYAFYLEDLDPRVLLLPVGDIDAARAAKPEATDLVDVLTEGGRVVLAHDGRTVEEAAWFEPAKADDIALLLHTSGTTSQPKQVPLMHRNLLSSAAAIAAHYRLSPADTSYCVMPLFHVHGLVASTLATLVAGGTVVVARRVSRQRLTIHLRKHGVTWFSAGPTLHHMLLEHVADQDAKLPSLRFLRSCSSALAPPLHDRAESHYGVPMLEAYGMTEASHQIASNPLPPEHQVPGSVGTATGTRIRIVDRSGDEMDDGRPGEVQIQGRGVTVGYLNNPDANAESFVDGWFRTGDLGVLDKGYLTLHGRLKELIIRGGENVSPTEVEDTLLGHPAVADAVCFGVPHQKYGEEVAAAVALRAESSERELIEHCYQRLIDFKVPKIVYILDSIPRTPTGKLQRRRVASMLLDVPQ